MPAVAELLTNIQSLALVGATGGDTSRVLNYFNMAYRKVYEKVTSKYPWAAQTTQTVAITAGSGPMNPVPLHILSVRDANNNCQKLDPTDVEDVECENPPLDRAGSPCKFWVEGFAILKAWPVNSTTVRVRYAPNPATLVANSAEEDIKIPPAFHDVLTWETLALMAYDERDKIVGAELAYNKDQHDEAYERMWSYFDAKAPKKQEQVKAYLI